MQIADVLHHKGSEVHKILARETIETAVRLLAERRVGALVVRDRWGKLVGMISERDVIRGLARHGPAALAMTVGDLMTPDPTTCRPADLIRDVMGLMTVHRVRHLPVVEGGQLRGLVSMGDLVAHRLDEKAHEVAVLRDLALTRH